MSPIAQLALQIAQTQKGIQELPKGSNAGVDVEKYLKSVGLGKGYSWCMAFVYWCVSESSIKLKLPNVLLKTGSVLAQYNYQKKQGCVVDVPQVGDIFIMDFGKGQGHTGWVIGVKGNRILTLEGNSNDDGSREGYEVCSKPNGRLISSCKGFIRLK